MGYTSLNEFPWLQVTRLLSGGGGVSWDDSTALLALAKAFDIVGSWNSCKKTPVGTIAQLEPSLANSSVISFFPHKICMHSRQSKLFSNLWSSWQYSNILSSKHDHCLMTCLMMSIESLKTLSQRMPSAMAILRTWSKASYSAALLDARKCICKTYLKLSPLGDVTRIPAPVPWSCKVSYPVPRNRNEASIRVPRMFKSHAWQQYDKQMQCYYHGCFCMVEFAVRTWLYHGYKLNWGSVFLS
jgi:hypothetical protein